MGSYQSKVSPETASHEKAILERLRSMQLSDDAPEDDFVHVDDEKRTSPRLTRQPEGLPVHLMGSWQSTLLEDPKNR